MLFQSNAQPTSVKRTAKLITATGLFSKMHTATLHLYIIQRMVFFLWTDQKNKP